MEAIWFDEFFAEGLITDVVSQLKSGKEATVFMCRAGAGSDAQLLAVKYFRPEARPRFPEPRGLPARARRG